MKKKTRKKIAKSLAGVFISMTMLGGAFGFVQLFYFTGIHLYAYIRPKAIVPVSQPQTKCFPLYQT